METPNLKKKFQGSLVGCLIGDCLGKPFESAELPVPINSKRVSKLFDALRNGEKQPGTLKYTDDTAMTKVLGRSLIETKSLNCQDLAMKLKHWVKCEPDRGYGIHVRQVLLRLTAQEPLKPARDQFNGRGSYGNGAAMRVTPVGLYFHRDVESLIEAAYESSLVTHAHCNGYNGAVLQALAVRQAGQPSFYPPTETCGKFIAGARTTRNKSCGENTALHSVPTAIFTFLMNALPIDSDDKENLFERTIQYAINLGGDTDTIACMAGGICGAHVGIDAIPRHLILPCEGYEELMFLAEELVND